MSVSPAFVEQVEELLGALGPLQTKRMFGAAGLYAHGVIFALLDDDTLFLKADAALAGALEAEGSAPFCYGPAGQETVMKGYWRLPDTAWDDGEAAMGWARRSLDCAYAAEAAKAAKTKRPSKAKGG